MGFFDKLWGRKPKKEEIDEEKDALKKDALQEEEGLDANELEEVIEEQLDETVEELAPYMPKENIPTDELVTEEVVQNAIEPIEEHQTEKLEIVEDVLAEKEELEEEVQDEAIEEVQIEAVVAEAKEQKKEDLNKGLKKSSQSIFARITKAVAGKDIVDDEVLDDIEEALVACDISVDTVIKIIERLEARVAKDKYLSVKEVYVMLKEEIIEMLTENNTPDYTSFDIPITNGCPYIMLVVGVNGAGKTTTIGKLAHQFKKLGKKVIVGAADTFRAAAVEQLDEWAKLVDVPIIKQKTGADPAAVAYDSVQAGLAQGADVIIVDTAGRLHNKKHLMDELTKIKRVMKKVDSDFPHDVMLVVDGSTGQNALLQAKAFTKATEVTCIAVTKLDGTAKGGAVIAIADQFKVPIKYIGVGEGAEQLQVFNKKEYVDSLFSD
jgi:fused signal recognition particle receptor